MLHSGLQGVKLKVYYAFKVFRLELGFRVPGLQVKSRRFAV